MRQRSLALASAALAALHARDVRLYTTAVDDDAADDPNGDGRDSPQRRDRDLGRDSEESPREAGDMLT